MGNKLSPAFMAHKPLYATASRLLNAWCLEKGYIPGANNYAKDEKNYKNKPLANNGEFRRIKDPSLGYADLVELYVEPFTVCKYNVSPETDRCGHPECEETTTVPKKVKEWLKELTPDGKIYFCRKQDGVFKRYLSECPPAARNITAMLLRKPTTSTHWFNRIVGQAEYELVKHEFNDLMEEPSIKIAELTKAFVTDADGLRKKHPDMVGRTIYENVKVKGIDNSSYMLLMNGTVQVVGAKLTTRLWPGIVNRSIRSVMRHVLEEDGIAEIMQGTERTKTINSIKEEFRAAEPERFLIETVLRKEPEEYGNVDRFDTMTRKAAGFAFDRLLKAGRTDPEFSDEDGKYMRFFLTEEKLPGDDRERQEFVISKKAVTPPVRVRLLEDPELDLDRVAKQHYFYNLTVPPMERVLGLKEGSLRRTVDNL
ncbi:MAG: hypothetical protein QXD77_00830 [Candidatus Aenigmatarchaeota archaeon]